MQTSDFYYELPKKYIAQTPLKERSSSKLLVLDKKTGEVEHKTFADIIDYLNEGDALVINDTRVIPARIFGYRQGYTGKIEVLLLRNLEKDKWECLVKPAKKVQVGTTLVFANGLLKAKVESIEEEGIRIIEFIYDGIFNEILDKVGVMPLPPYITEELQDKERYQTVYSKIEGSAAAPTAGLHFTNELLEKIAQKGVNIVHVTLHVGLGTFRPVKEQSVEEHTMHSEYFEITKEACDVLNETRSANKRVICVGTTSVRVLESASDSNGILHPMKRDTNIYIYPGYHFKFVDNLITNFHLPESTLLMLVSALASKEYILNAYEIAKEENYRFFSFGDAMYIKGESYGG